MNHNIRLDTSFLETVLWQLFANSMSKDLCEVLYTIFFLSLQQTRKMGILILILLRDKSQKINLFYSNVLLIKGKVRHQTQTHVVSPTFHA